MASLLHEVVIRLRLYVAGSAPNSLRAIENASTIGEEHFAGRYELEIVDLIKQPERALEDGIIVTPTLIKLGPPPVLRIIGNLGDTEQVLIALASE